MRIFNSFRPYARITRLALCMTLLLGLAAAGLAARPTYAFCNDPASNNGSTCHPQIVERALPFLRSPFRKAIANHVNEPDDNGFLGLGYASDDHFDTCNFDGGTERINNRYLNTILWPIQGVVPALSPYEVLTGGGTRQTAAPFVAAQSWAWALHAAQDFYSHSNWVEMGFTDASKVLVDSNLGPWTELSANWGPVREGVITSQQDPPAGWKISYPDNPRVPVVTTDTGQQYLLLISGTVEPNPNQSCPAGAKITHATLNKDNNSRSYNDQALAMAINQTRHEWCRLLNLALQTNGYAGAAVPIGLLVAPGASPHPAWTACAEAPAGPIQLNVQVTRMVALDNGEDDKSENGEVRYVLTLFSDDFRHSVRAQTPIIFAPSNTVVPAGELPAPLTLCISPDERLIATIQGWDDDDAQGTALFGELSPGDDVLAGLTYQAGLGADFAANARTVRVNRRSDNANNQDIEASFTITNERTDEDGDGLTYCQELANGFDPRNPDSDGDGVGDAQEVRLDLSFGALAGRTTTRVGSGDDRAFAAVVQPDGKIVLAGEAETNTINGTQAALARYRFDGTLDTAFGAGGRVLAGLYGTDAARALALAPDGKIIVAGYRGDTDADFAVWRFNADGTPDSTFNLLGFSLVDFGLGSDYGQAVLVQPDNKVVVAGFAASGTSIDPDRVVFAVARFRDDGKLDLSFGNGGRATAVLGSGYVRARAAILQPDGKILVVGGHAGNFAVVRFTALGVLDTTFGQGGKVELTLGGNDEARAIAMLPDGLIAVAGYAGGDFGLVFLNPNGQICLCGAVDARFRVDFGGNESVYAIAVQEDGRIMLAGSENGLDPAESRFKITRFGKTRFRFGYALDRRFGRDGLLVTPLANRAVARAIAIDALRWFVVAGYARNPSDDDFALARYMGVSLLGPAPDESRMYLPLVVEP